MIDDTRGNFRVGMRLHKLIRRKTGKRKGKERKGKERFMRRVDTGEPFIGSMIAK